MTPAENQLLLVVNFHLMQNFNRWCYKSNKEEWLNSQLQHKNRKDTVFSMNEITHTILFQQTLW